MVHDACKYRCRPIYICIALQDDGRVKFERCEYCTSLCISCMVERMVSTSLLRAATSCRSWSTPGPASSSLCGCKEGDDGGHMQRAQPAGATTDTESFLIIFVPVHLSTPRVRATLTGGSSRLPAYSMLGMQVSRGLPIVLRQPHTAVPQENKSGCGWTPGVVSSDIQPHAQISKAEGILVESPAIYES